MPLAFQLRDNTQDRQVFDDVIIANQYNLPDQLPPDSIIIDIGANVGAFAVACLARGAGTVICFEPCKDNFAQLLLNTAAWPGKVAPFNAAVWRSDRNERLDFVHPGSKNTACGAVIPENRQIDQAKIFVESMGLDELLFHATDGGKRRVYILKIDAEGSEYPILYTAKHLHVVDNLIGETHQYPAAWPGDRFFVGEYDNEQASAIGMRNFLESQGFAVEQKDEAEDNQICTLFWGTRLTTPEKI